MSPMSKGRTTPSPEIRIVSANIVQNTVRYGRTKAITRANSRRSKALPDVLFASLMDR